MIRLITSIIVSLALLFPTPLPERKGPSSQHNAPSSPGHRKPAVAQELFCPLWRIDQTFQATMRIKNELVIGAMTVTPVLFMADGTEYDVLPITIKPSDVAVVSINDALRGAPPGIQEHVSQFGSASLRFQYGWNAVSASIQSLDAPRSLVYQYPFVGSMTMDSGTQQLEGLWWKHDSGVGGFIALSNATSSPIDARVALSDSRGLGGPGGVFSVPTHGTHFFQFSDVDLATLRDERGGVSISWTGAPNALMVAGGLENVVEGFSAPMVFRAMRDRKDGKRDQHKNQQIAIMKTGDQTVSFASVGIMVGDPDPMMNLPPATKFTPYAILRNGGSRPLDVQPHLYYMQGMETKPLQVKSLRLLARQTVALNINGILEASGLKNYSGTVHLRLSYQGSPQALIVATGSVDQTGSYVFDVGAKGINQDRGKRISYWQNDPNTGTNTMFTLWNPESASQDLLVTLYFRDGSYKLPVHLDTNGTSMFNIAELAMKQGPDADGHVLPQYATIGSAVVTDAASRLNKVKIVVSAGVFSVQNATCAEQCSGCDDIQEVDLSSAYLNVGDQVQLAAECIFSDGTPYDCTYWIYNWSTSNSSVAAVTDYGEVSALDTGYADVRGYLDETVTDPLCYTQGICDYTTLFPSGFVSIAPTGFSISVTSTSVQGETNSLVSGQSGQVQVTVLGVNGSTATYYTDTVHFSSTDSGATLPADYSYAYSDHGVHTFNIALKTVSGNSPTRDLAVRDSTSGVSATQNINLWFQVIATREGLVGGTTSCGHVITQNDHFVALPATGLCNVGVRLRNGANLASTTVLDVGPWCPNTPGPGNSNTCSCPSDRYWQTSGVPFAAGASCATTHAGIDLADGTFADLGLTGNGNIYWRFQ